MLAGSIAAIASAPSTTTTGSCVPATLPAVTDSVKLPALAFGISSVSHARCVAPSSVVTIDVSTSRSVLGPDDSWTWPNKATPTSTWPAPYTTGMPLGMSSNVAGTVPIVSIVRSGQHLAVEQIVGRRVQDAQVVRQAAGAAHRHDVAVLVIEPHTGAAVVVDGVRERQRHVHAGGNLDVELDLLRATDCRRERAADDERAEQRAADELQAAGGFGRAGLAGRALAGVGPLAADARGNRDQEPRRN